MPDHRLTRPIALHESVLGTSATSAHVRFTAAFGGKADLSRRRAPGSERTDKTPPGRTTPIVTSRGYLLRRRPGTTPAGRGALWPRPWPGSDPLLPHAATRRCTLPRRVTNDAGRRTASSSAASRRSRTRRPAARAARRNLPVTCHSGALGVCAGDSQSFPACECGRRRAGARILVRGSPRPAHIVPCPTSPIPPRPSKCRDGPLSLPADDVPPRGQRPGAGVGSKRERAGLRDGGANRSPGRRYVAGYDRAGREPGRRPPAVLENA